MNLKGQGALEFTIITVTMLIAFSGVFLFMEYQFAQAQQDREDALVQDVIEHLQGEIEVAALAGEGYQRVFYLPQAIVGIPYDVHFNFNLTPNMKDELVFTYKETEHLRFIFYDVDGDTTDGEEPIYSGVPIQKGYFCIRGGSPIMLYSLESEMECP